MDMDPKDARDLEALDALLALPANDPRRAALESDPRLKSLADSHRLFESREHGEAAPHVEDAEARLAAWRQATFGGAPSGAGTRTLRSAPARPWWDVLWTPALRPALAMAAVAVVIGGALLWPLVAPRGGRVVLRGGAGAALSLVAPRADASGVTLEWAAAPGADAYEVVFYTTELDEVARRPAGTSTTLRLTEADLPEAYRSGQAVLYRVIAREKGDETARSPVGTLRRP